MGWETGVNNGSSDGVIHEVPPLGADQRCLAQLHPMTPSSSQSTWGRRVGEARGGGCRRRVTWREVILRARSMRIQVTVSEQGGVLREP